MRDKFHYNVPNSGIKKKKKGPSIKELEGLFELLEDAESKGIKITDIANGFVFLTFYDRISKQTEEKHLSFVQAAIFFKDILETY